MTKIEEVTARLGRETKVLTSGLQRAWASPDGRRKLIKFGIAGAALLSLGMLSLLAAMPNSSGRSNRPPAGFAPPPSAIAPVQPVQQQGLPQTGAPSAPAVGAPIQAAPQFGAPAVGAPIQAGAFAPKAETRTVKVGTSEAISAPGNGGPAPAMIGASNHGAPTIQPSIDLDSLIKREGQ
jgi:hypothetical protein